MRIIARSALAVSVFAVAAYFVGLSLNHELDDLLDSRITAQLSRIKENLPQTRNSFESPAGVAQAALNP